MPKFVLTAFLSLVFFACLPPAGPRDPVFASIRVTAQSQLQAELTNVDSAMAQFDGAMVGLTDAQRDTPRYHSLVGRYNAVVKQVADAKRRAHTLLDWATATEATATLEDRTRLENETIGLRTELGNLGATVHQLPAEINVIQMTSR